MRAAIAYDPSRTALYSPERHETFFAVGERYTRAQQAVEAARLAYYRAEESAVEHQRLAEALQRVGFGPPHLFVDQASGSVGFGSLHAGDNSALVAFRGTQPDEIRTIATDIKAHQVPWTETGGRVHAGFAGAARVMLPAVHDWLASGPGAGRAALVLTGHSLGAAIATLAATVLAPTLLVTIGSPRVGDAEFMRALDDVPMLRVVDGCDVVTQLPPALALYAHAGPATYIPCEEGAEIVTDPAATFVEADRIKARARYVVDHAWKKEAVLLRDLADHAPVNYVRRYLG